MRVDMMVEDVMLARMSITDDLSIFGIPFSERLGSVVSCIVSYTVLERLACQWH